MSAATQTVFMYKLTISLYSGHTFDQAVQWSHMAWSSCRTFPLRALTLALTAAPLSLNFKIFERRMLPLYKAIEEKSLRVWSDLQLRNFRNCL